MEHATDRSPGRSPLRSTRRPVRPAAAAVPLACLALLALSTPPGRLAWCQEAAIEVETRGCLWEATAPGQTIVILGSIHISPDEIYPLPAAIDSAYARSDIVVFEADLDSLGSASFQMAMLGAGMFADGTTLETALGDSSYARLAARLETMGMPVAAFAKMKPWLCAVSLTGIELMKLGFDPANGIDVHFHERAKADGKPIVGLETPAFQLGLFADLDATQGELMLMKTLAELEMLETMADDLLDSWSRGDLDKLDAMLVDSFSEFPEVLTIFLTDRNERWVPQLVELAANGDDLFVVVGAGHLVGQQGVLALLEQRGYEVVQR